MKWGIDRLPLLVEADLRDRFWAQMDVLNKAIDKGSGVEVEEAVASTIRGVEALERGAIELGAEPVSGEVWRGDDAEGRCRGSVPGQGGDRQDTGQRQD